MTTIDMTREAALALPEATERDHHGLPSFRVGGRIFATVPDDLHVRIMIDEHDTRALAKGNPTAFQEYWFGARLACAVVNIAVVEIEEVTELLTDAWRRKAPRRLVLAFDESR
jgi:hypothetical protein